jgi:4-nitrophenyl phosphatase
MSTQRPVVVCDLDGVIWLADTVIEGAASAVAALRVAGYQLLFVTNNSFAPVADVETKLASMGVPAVGEVLTSGMAAAGLVDAGARVMLAGGPGAREELERRQARIVEGGPVDVVVVGFHRTFDYDELTRCAAAVRAGARLIGTNGDATYPTPDGEIPGGGAILAAIAVAAGVAPEVAGKPHEPMAALVRARVGEAALVMVGDRLDTDGLFAERLGARFVHVLSGVRPPVPETLRPNVWLEAVDLAAAVPKLIDHGS